MPVECKEITFRKEVERNLNVCPKCGHHFRVTVDQRLSIRVDPRTWRELFADLAIGDPLDSSIRGRTRSGWKRRAATAGRNDAS